jgi:hypothetical protein
VCPWLGIMVYTALPVIGLPVHDLASWFVSAPLLGWFCVSMVWHHGLYRFPWNRLACPKIWLHGLYLHHYWDGFVCMSTVCCHGLYHFPGIGLIVHDLASWFVSTTILGWVCVTMVWHHDLYQFAGIGLPVHDLASWFVSTTKL